MRKLTLMLQNHGKNQQKRKYSYQLSNACFGGELP